MSLARGLSTQVSVIHALILRETRTRFGAHQLGYIWALVEPALMILTFFILFEIAGRRAPFEMDLYGFVITGFIPYALFTSCVNRVAESINGNRALLFYPHVHPLDLVFARAILESVTHVIVLAVLMGGYALYRQELVIDDLLLVTWGLLLAALLGMTLGMVFCALGQFTNVVDRTRGPLMRPLFWVSGIFFAANELPGAARDLLLWNPILHTTELVRDGWYPTYTAHHIDSAYVLGYVLVFAFVGLALERVVRRRIEVT